MNRRQNTSLPGIDAAAEESLMFDGCRTEDGYPLYWRWDPARLDAHLATKLRARRLRGYGNPPLLLPEERTLVQGRLDELDVNYAQAAVQLGIGPAQIRQALAGGDLKVLQREYRRWRTKLCGTEFDRYPRSFARSLVVPLDLQRKVITRDFRAMPAPVLSGAVVCGAAVFAGGMLGGAIALVVFVAALAAASAVRAWAGRDPLRLVEADLAAIAANFEPITVPAGFGTLERRLALRAWIACDRIASSPTYQHSTQLAEHRTMFDVADQLKQMISHAHQIHCAHVSLDSEHSAVCEDEQEQQVLASSIGHLRRQVEIAEAFAAGLSALDRDLAREQDRIRRISQIGPVEALHRFDAASELIATSFEKLPRVDNFDAVVTVDLTDRDITEVAGQLFGPESTAQSRDESGEE
ncbi:hypothetical protein AB0N05_37675 [Nocardia sp. NPDC051030]|uniref:hypothetical protein n=1 Tax=Nocardia sp. NPDC051030 TaxID=3155162 RepID=UPI00343013F5